MCTPHKDSAWTRYLTLGLRNGELHHILARRGHTPDDIVRQTLEINTRNRRAGFDRMASSPVFEKLYILEVGPEGVYGQSTNLKLQEIVPPPRRDWELKTVRGLY